jgi:hypothetical protein
MASRDGDNVDMLLQRQDFGRAGDGKDGYDVSRCSVDLNIPTDHNAFLEIPKSPF